MLRDRTRYNRVIHGGFVRFPWRLVKFQKLAGYPRSKRFRSALPPPPLRRSSFLSASMPYISIAKKY